MVFFKKIAVITMFFLCLYNLLLCQKSYAAGLEDVFKGGDEFIGSAEGESLFDNKAVGNNVNDLYSIGLGIRNSNSSSCRCNFRNTIYSFCYRRKS